MTARRDQIAAENRKLVLSVSIKDCEVQEFRAGGPGGPGGQKQNKTSSAIRVIHHPSGARGESREQRSQLQNKRTAFTRMVGTLQFTMWMTRQLATGPSPEERVERDMAPENLRVEYRHDGRWVQSADIREEA